MGNILKYGDKILYFNGLPLKYNLEAPPAPSWPTDGLVARWTFEDTMYDTINNIIFETGGAGYPTYSAGGKIGKYLKAGSSPYYIASTSNSLITNNLKTAHAYTTSNWIKIDNGNADYSNYIGSIGADDGMHQICDNSGSASNKLAYWARNNSGSSKLWESTFTLTFGQWYHLVVRWDGTTTTVFVDNTSVFSANESANTMPGNNFTIATGYYAGMDLAYFYSKALSDAEVAQLYNSGNGI
jgi:hypothetical protein